MSKDEFEFKPWGTLRDVKHVSPRPNHPGYILLINYVEPLGLSCATLAQLLDIPNERARALLDKQLSVDEDLAQRLARTFDTSAKIWLQVQAAYDEWEREQEE